jgi:signal transduction histidine kinase
MSEKILWVDDDENLLASYRRQLRNKFPVMTAAGGEQGLRIIGAEGPFAVIVSDFRMPGMDGVQFLSKAREAAPDSVRMLLTGYADLQTAIDAVNQGNIFRLLTKPCAPDVLLAALTAGITQYRLIISERERAEKERASLEEQLRHAQKMESIGRLAGGVAHDFNNFLTVINTTSQLALMELEDGDPWREKFESIEKAGERAANLTRQLLAFSSRHAVEMKVIDANALIKGLNKMLLRVIGEDIEFRTVLAEDLGRIKVDPGQVEQAILNLVVNARDAMPSGGTLVLETANTELDEKGTHPPLSLKPGAYVTLSVKDTGMGITPEIQEKIFEPFFTTKEKGKGTGLGLSIVYGIVKQSGGGIEVQSKPGQGTAFKLYLPRADGPLEGPKKEAVREGLPRGTETVLVAEDDDGVRRLAADILRKQGYRVIEASSGGEALGILGPNRESIHLLLTDVVMPEVSGPELARRLAYFYPEMKVLYMSGYGDHGIFQNGLLDRGKFFLQKPFSVESLTAKVRQVLDRG